MRSGTLRHLVTINKYSTTPSDQGTGEGVASYTPLAPQVWAEIKPLTGRELMNAQEVIGDVSHQIRIRYNGNVTRQDQILFTEDFINGDGSVTHTYEIDAVMNTDMRGIEAVLLCHEIT